MTKKVTVDDVIAAFIATRDEIAEIKRKRDNEVAELEKKQELREGWLMDQLKKLGVDSLRSSHGTVFTTRKESIRVADWDKLLNGYIIPNGAWELLNKAVNKTAALEIMGEERDIRKLPGIGYTAIREVSVRRG